MRSFEKGGSEDALDKTKKKGILVKCTRILFNPHAALSSRTFKETVDQIYLDRGKFPSSLKNTFSKKFMIGSDKKYRIRNLKFNPPVLRHPAWRVKKFQFLAAVTKNNFS